MTKSLNLNSNTTSVQKEVVLTERSSRALYLNSNNPLQSYCKDFKGRKVFIEQASRGRSINTVPVGMEKDSTVPSFDSNSTVGRHTQVLRQTDSSHQSVLGAPAPGIPVGSAAVSYSDLCRIILHLHFKCLNTLIMIDALVYYV